MNETNFDWDDLRLFLAVARSGGLAAAIDTTGKSAPTLGRRMLQLERRLGQELFHRQARGYTLTQAGTLFFKQIVELENDLIPIVRTSAQRNHPVIKVSAGTWVSTLLCQHMPQIIKNDALQLRFVSADAVVDIGRREALIGVRNQRPSDIALAGRRVGSIEFALFARSEKVKTYGRVLGNTPSAKWAQEQFKDAPTIDITHPRNALDLALSGAARVLLPTFIGDSTDGVIRVSDTIAELEHEQWLVMHHEDRHIPEVRVVIERILAILKAHCAV